MERMNDLCEKYLKEFGELPHLPMMVSYGMIADLMEESLISRIPVDPDEIAERIKKSNEPSDLA